MHRWTMEMVTHYRKEMGWSQEEFATRLGYAHRQSVCNWITTGIPKEKFKDAVRLLAIPEEEITEAMTKDFKESLKQKLA